MRYLALAALLFSSPARAAGDKEMHRLTAIIYDKSEAYAQAVDVQRGETAAFDGEVRGQKKGRKRRLILNYNLGTMIGPGAEQEQFLLQYQAELEGEAKGVAALQAQGELALKPDAGLAVVECSGWTVYLHLDPSGDKKKAAAALKGLRNWMVKSEYLSGKRKVSCSQLTQLGSQANIVHQVYSKKKGAVTALLLNTLLNETDKGWDLQFQFQAPSPRGGDPVVLTQTAKIEPGKQRLSKGAGWVLALSVEQP